MVGENKAFEKFESCPIKLVIQVEEVVEEGNEEGSEGENRIILVEEEVGDGEEEEGEVDLEEESESGLGQSGGEGEREKEETYSVGQEELDRELLSASTQLVEGAYPWEEGSEEEEETTEAEGPYPWEGGSEEEEEKEKEKEKEKEEVEVEVDFEEFSEGVEERSTPKRRGKKRKRSDKSSSQ